MPAEPIFFSNPKAAYQEHHEEIEAAFQRCLRSGYYILGPEVQTFESAFATFAGLKHCVTVNNGTDALVLALKALGIGAGDEVITVSHTAVATVAAIEICGATPVLADIDPQTYCLDPQQLESLLTEKTKAILPVHLYGHPADMPTIIGFAKTHQIYVVEDCAQAHGATLNGQMVGTFGDLSCYSFYPTKNLGALGDGGAILTNDPRLAEQVRLLRQYGWKDRYISQIQGANSRMDELQAAVLNVKLIYLKADNFRREQIARIYDQRLANTAFQLPKVAKNASHAHHLYVIQTERRDQLQAYLQQHQIFTGIHYPLAIHQQPAYLGRLRGADRLPVTEALIPRILSLPIYPQLPMPDLERICALLSKWQ